MTVAVTVAPLEIAPSAQCSFPAAIAHAGEGCVPVNVTPVGAVSSRTTLAAWDGPELCTTSCQVALPPATGVPDSNVLTTDRSADAVTGAAAVAVDDSGVVLTSRRGDRGGVADRASDRRGRGHRHREGHRSVSPATTDGQVQTTGSASWQLPPSEAFAVTSVVPVGSGSVSTMRVVSDGPLLVATTR